MLSVTRRTTGMIFVLRVFLSRRSPFQKYRNKPDRRREDAHRNDRHNWHQFFQRHGVTFRKRSIKMPITSRVALMLDVTKNQSAVKVARCPITRSIGTNTAVRTAASRRKSATISPRPFLFSTAQQFYSLAQHKGKIPATNSVQSIAGLKAHGPSRLISPFAMRRRVST